MPRPHRGGGAGAYCRAPAAHLSLTGVGAPTPYQTFGCYAALGPTRSADGCLCARGHVPVWYILSGRARGVAVSR